MTAKSPWLYTSLCGQPGVFGTFEKCLTFSSEIRVSKTPFQNDMERRLRSCRRKMHPTLNQAQRLQAVSSFPKEKFFSPNRMFIITSMVSKRSVILSLERVSLQHLLISFQTLGWTGRLYNVGILRPLETATDEPCRAFISPCAANNGRLPLPLSRRLFDHVIGTFNISPTFLTVLNSGVARYTSSSTRDKIGNERGQARTSADREIPTH